MKFKYKPGASVKIIFSFNPEHVGKVVQIIGIHQKTVILSNKQYDITNPLGGFVSTFYNQEYLEPAYEI